MNKYLEKIKYFFQTAFSKNKEKRLESPEEKFDRQLGEKVDDILEHYVDDKDLANRLIKQYDAQLKFNGINANDPRIQKYNVKGQYPLQTKLSKEQTLKLVGEFLTSIFPERKQHFLDILNGKGQNSDTQKIYLNLDEIGESEPYTTSPRYPSDDINIDIPIYGDLRDAYSVVHETFHTEDCINGANETRSIFGEINSQCAERFFDDFLKGLPPEKMEEYGFDYEILNRDIEDRKLSTFVNRFNIIKDIPNLEGAEKMMATRYMLAQIFQTRFLKFTSNSQKRISILSSMSKKIQNNDTYTINSPLRIDLFSDRSIDRDFYVDETIGDFISDFNSRNKQQSQEEIFKGIEDKYKNILLEKPKEVLDRAFEVIEDRKRQVAEGNKPKLEVLDPEVREIFDLMEEFKKEIKESFIKNKGQLTHITSVAPQDIEGRKLKKSSNRANNYETDRVDGVFASSESLDGTNPYIARNKDGMISIGPDKYIYGGNNFLVVKDKEGVKHALLKQNNYAYFLNPDEFEPVVTLKRDNNGNPEFEFSKEWISEEEISLEDPTQAYGFTVLSDVTDLLKHYQVLSDVNCQGLGMQIRGKKKEDAIQFVLEQIETGNLRYINEEARINSIDLRKQNQLETKD